jgi:hypothetical protein
MAIKLISTAVCILLGISVKGEGVIRVDLERKLVDRHGNIMLSDTVDVDKMVMIDSNATAGVDIDLLIDTDEDNYSVLRDQNRNNLHKSIR